MTDIPQPDLGLAAVDFLSHKWVLGFDCETFALTTASFGKKMFMTRSTARLVCTTWAGREGMPPIFDELAAKGQAVLSKSLKAWRALVDREGSKAVLRWVMDPANDAMLVGHNTPYDLIAGLDLVREPEFWSNTFRAVEEGRVADTFIRDKLVAIAYDTHDYCPVLNKFRPTFGLAECVKRHLGITLGGKTGEDVWRLRYHELDGIELSEWPQAAVDYALDDAEWPLLVALTQAPIASPRLTDQLDPVTTHAAGVVDEIRQLRGHMALSLMSNWGVRTDPDMVAKWEADIDMHVEEANAAGRRLGYLRANGTTNLKKLREFIREDLERQGIFDDGLHLTEKGSVKTDEKTLMQCQTPELRARGENSAYAKYKSTYLNPAKLGIDSTVPYNFNPLVNTGRTSSFKTNIQNPPRAGLFRECIVPRQGMVFNSADYTAAELCALGQMHYWVFGRSKMRDVINSGTDPHCVVGAQLAGVPLEEFMTWMVKGHPRFKEAKFVYRQCAKVANFGFPGGLGSKTLVDYAKDGYGVDLYEIAVKLGRAEATDDLHARRAISESYSAEIQRAWKAAFPEADEYMQLIGDACPHGTTFTFEQFVTRRQRGGCNYTSGNNSGFQGLVADGAKEAMWRLAVMCYVPPDSAVDILKDCGWGEGDRVEEWAQALYGVRPVFFIHDEVMCEGPEETAHIWGPAQADVMREGLELLIPDTKISIEPALQRRWYKAAEEAYDEDGKLIPWEPSNK